MTQIVFETHSLSEDNMLGVASGWYDSHLSEQGRQLAAELGQRRREDGIHVIFTSDLERAIETARIALGDTAIPILADWRLRECNYGSLNGTPSAQLHQYRERYLHKAYSGGESWQQAIDRVGRFLDDLWLRWANARVLVIGHVATRWGLDHFINGLALEDLMQSDFNWQEGWEYQLRHKNKFES